jgi:hypothetical protein
MTEHPIRASAADREWIHGDDGRDTPFADRQSVVLCHGMSPELTPGGPRFAPGAAIGDFVVPQGDTRKVFKGETGFVAHILGFELRHPEYTVGVGDDRGEFVADHGVNRPKDAVWRKAADGLVKKDGYYRTGADGRPGNKVVPTINVYMLVGGCGVVYSGYGTAYNPIRELAVSAERLRAQVGVEGEDGKVAEIVEVRGCALGLFKFTSKFETKAFTFPVPVWERLGKLGEANGPTFDQYRFAQRLRTQFKQGLDWLPQEALEPPAPPPEIEARRTTTINNVVTEINPPPHEGETDWDFDDDIKF